MSLWYSDNQPNPKVKRYCRAVTARLGGRAVRYCDGRAIDGTKYCRKHRPLYLVEVVYKGQNGELDRKLERTVAKVDPNAYMGSGLCLLDWTRDLTFEFKNKTKAAKAARLLRALPEAKGGLYRRGFSVHVRTLNGGL